MIACVILLSALVVTGIVLRLLHKEDVPAAGEDAPRETTTVGSDETECCGTHAVCIKINDSRLGAVEYFDDEELDRYAGRKANAYSDEEVDEFRDVLLTLLPADVGPWGASLEKRGIELPLSLRDEFIILLESA